MTVRELIEQLQNLPPDAPVVVQGRSGQAFDSIGAPLIVTNLQPSASRAGLFWQEPTGQTTAILVAKDSAA